jgi:hypothetical protein
LAADNVVFRLIYSTKITVTSQISHPEARHRIKRHARIALIGLAGEMICLSVAMILLAVFDDMFLGQAMSDAWAVTGGFCAFVHYNHVLVILRAEVRPAKTNLTNKEVVTRIGVSGDDLRVPVERMPSREV